MNAHPQFAESLALYAMGSLDDPKELATLESHLGTCGDCRRELEALRADTALLALSATGPQPPARSRERLLNAVATEPRTERRNPQRYAIGHLRRRWVTIAPVMMMLILAVFSILLWRDLRNTRQALRRTHAELEQAQLELARTNKDLAEAKMVHDLLHASDAQPLTLVRSKMPPQPQIKAVYSKQQGSLLLMASSMTSLPDNKIYQVWLLPADGSAPMSAGWFKADTKGNGMMFHKMSSGIAAKGFAVTIEPPGGSQTPTMPIVMEPAG